MTSLTQSGNSPSCSAVGLASRFAKLCSINPVTTLELCSSPFSATVWGYAVYLGISGRHIHLWPFRLGLPTLNVDVKSGLVTALDLLSHGQEWFCLPKYKEESRLICTLEAGQYTSVLLHILKQLCNLIPVTLIHGP